MTSQGTARVTEPWAHFLRNHLRLNTDCYEIQTHERMWSCTCVESRVSPQRLSPELYNAAMTAEPREAQPTFSFSLISQTCLKPSVPKTDLSASPWRHRRTCKNRYRARFDERKWSSLLPGVRVEMKWMIHQFGPWANQSLAFLTSQAHGTPSKNLPVKHTLMAVVWFPIKAGTERAAARRCQTMTSHRKRLTTKAARALTC